MARKPTPSQAARIKLAAQLTKSQDATGSPVDPRQRGKAQAEQETDQPENRHSRALVNAVAVGPGRVRDDERRLMLARLLAQRTQREAGNARLWTALAERLINDIEALEEESASAEQRQAGQLGNLLDQKILDEESRRLRMQLVERFLHSLDRAVSAQEVVRREGQKKQPADGPAERVEGQAQNQAAEQIPATQAQGGDDGR